MHVKYDLLVGKGFKQRELMDKMVFAPRIHPAHQKYKADFFQEWDYRQRQIHDRMWPPYFSVHQAKGANGGLWPKELTKVTTSSPCSIAYPYNLLTGYHYNPPFGIDVSEGKYFNPYFDHMILGMPPQLHDGMIEFDDGTPASAPQMAHDVSEYLQYCARHRGPDDKVVAYLAMICLSTFFPAAYLIAKYHYVNCYSHRLEAYAVKTGGYKKFRDKMWRTAKVDGNWRGNFT